MMEKEIANWIDRWRQRYRERDQFKDNSIERASATDCRRKLTSLPCRGPNANGAINETLPSKRYGIISSTFGSIEKEKELSYITNVFLISYGYLIDFVNFDIFQIKQIIFHFWLLTH